MSANKKLLISFLIATAIFLFLSGEVFALENGNFESETISPWGSYSGASAGISNEEIHGGNYSVKVLNGSTTAVGIQQLITGIIGSRTYMLSGYTKVTDSNIGKTLLRIAWYSSSDGSDEQMSTVDSALVTGVGDWRKIEVTAAAPSEANSAKIRAVVSSATGGVQAFAYFDDLVFEEVILPSPTLTPTPTQTPPPTLTPIPPTSTTIPTNTPAPTSYSNIYISEFMANPESGNEWVELFNDNDSEVNLFGWYIDDITGGGKSPRAISGTILANGYKQFFLDDSFFNNNGDDVRLLDGSQAEKDKKAFDSSTKGKSWSKDSSGDWCQTDPTPNSANPDCPSSAASPTNTLTPTLSPTPTKKLTPSPTAFGSPTPVSGEVLGEEVASESGPFTLSGAAESSPASGQKEGKSGKSTSDRKRSIIFASVMSLGGIALTGFSVYSLWRRKKLVPEIKL